MVAAVDPFRCPSHWLPKDRSGQPVLPTFYIAALEAGGPPLMSAPNMPHMVITIQDCVMVEQRRLSLMCMDEVAYFAERVRRWRDPPVLYKAFSQGMSDAVYVGQRIIMPLLRRLRAAVMAGLDTLSPSERLFAQRSYLSLQALVKYRRNFAIAPELLRSLKQHLTDAAAAAPTLAQQDGRGQHLEAAQQNMRQAASGVTCLPNGQFVAYIHVAARPRWGTVRDNLGRAKVDQKLLQDAVKAGNLEALLLQMAGGEDLGAADAAAAEAEEDDLFD